MTNQTYSSQKIARDLRRQTKNFNLAGRLGTPSGLRHAPVNAGQKVGQLRDADRDNTVCQRRPQKAAALQSPRKQARALTIMPNNLDQVAATSPKNVEITNMRIALQSLLHETRKAREAAPHKPGWPQRRQQMATPRSRVASRKAGLCDGARPRSFRFPRKSVKLGRAGVIAIPDKPSKSGRVADFRPGPTVAVHHRQAIAEDMNSSEIATIEDRGALGTLEKRQPKQHHDAWA